MCTGVQVYSFMMMVVGGGMLALPERYAEEFLYMFKSPKYLKLCELLKSESIIL